MADGSIACLARKLRIEAESTSNLGGNDRSSTALVETAELFLALNQRLGWPVSTGKSESTGCSTGTEVDTQLTNEFDGNPHGNDPHDINAIPARGRD